MPTVKYLTCTLEDCTEKHYGQGYCRLHYNRYYFRKTNHKSIKHIELNRKEKHDEILQSVVKVDYNNFIIKAIPTVKNSAWSLAIMKLNKNEELVYCGGIPAVFATSDDAITEGKNIIKRGFKK